MTDGRITARHNLPASKYPIKVLLLHWKTREVLWTYTVPLPTEPADDPTIKMKIPGRQELRVPVIARIEFGDGTVQEGPPPPDTIPN